MNTPDKTPPIKPIKANSNDSNAVIPLDRLFNDDNEQVIDAYEEDKQIERLKQQKITRIEKMS